MFRIGQSTDIHKLAANERLILGGIDIKSDIGTIAHSDGDCLLHAITESIIGALGLGDLGSFFPDNDPKYKDMDSSYFLKKVVKIMEENNYKINNIDTLILIEKPKMSPFIKDMRINIAKVLNTDVRNVNVKATTGEKVGIVGNSLAVVCQSIVLLTTKRKIKEL